MSDHTPEQLADELEYAEQWLLQGMPAGSVTPSAAVLREAAAALRAQADAEPAAYSFEAKHIDSAWGPVLTSKAPVEGPYVRNIRPLYAAPAPAEPAAPARPTDDALWDQTLRERDDYQDWADKLAESISRFIGFGIGEHSSANNPWARALDMMPAGTLHEALARHQPSAAVLNLLRECRDAIDWCAEECGHTAARDLAKKIEATLAAHPPAALRQQAEPGELPPLPDPLVMVNRYGASASTADGDGGVFTADQMQAYARLALAQSPLPKERVERVERVMDAVREALDMQGRLTIGKASGGDVRDALAAVRAILEGRQP